MLSTGLRTEWGLGGVAVFGAAAALRVAAMLGKLAGMHPAGPSRAGPLPRPRWWAGCCRPRGCA